MLQSLSIILARLGAIVFGSLRVTFKIIYHILLDYQMHYETNKA